MNCRTCTLSIPSITLLPLVVILFLSCTQGKPILHSSVVQLVLVETENGSFAERLSYFAFFDDPDGAYDFGSIRIVHDETALEWTILPADAEVRLRGADRWTGSADLAGPGNTPFPGGEYSVTVSDLAGNEVPGSFTLVRPLFPERAPAVFSVQGQDWEIVRNRDARAFDKTFLLLYNTAGQLLYSYRVADTTNNRVAGTIASLKALAREAATVRCYTENESGSAGVLLIPVDIR